MANLERPTGFYGQRMYHTPISKMLHFIGLYGRVARKKQFLKKVHLEARLKFAQRYLEDPATNWQKALCSDETKIELFGMFLAK